MDAVARRESGTHRRRATEQQKVFRVTRRESPENAFACSERESAGEQGGDNVSDTWKRGSVYMFQPLERSVGANDGQHIHTRTEVVVRLRFTAVWRESMRAMGRTSRSRTRVERRVCSREEG